MLASLVDQLPDSHIAALQHDRCMAAGTPHQGHQHCSQASNLDFNVVRTQCALVHCTGRVDDVINVSGHRIGTAEVESALVNHPACAEAAVVPVEHPIKGQGIYAFVTLMEVCDMIPLTMYCGPDVPVNKLQYIRWNKRCALVPKITTLLVWWHGSCVRRASAILEHYCWRMSTLECAQ